MKYGVKLAIGVGAVLTVLISAEPSAAMDEGWYVQGTIGAALQENTDAEFVSSPGTTPVTSEYDLGVALSGAVGYQINQNFRIDGELGYLKNDTDTATQGNTTDGISGDTSMLTGMVNGYAVYPIDGWAPYMGVGLGVVRQSTDTKASTNFNAIDDSDTAFAYQIMLGVDRNITERLALGVGYRFLGSADVQVADSANSVLETDFKVHRIEMRLRYGF